MFSLFADGCEAAERADVSGTKGLRAQTSLLPGLLLMSALIPMAAAAGTNAVAQLFSATGPTIRLDYEGGMWAGNPIAAFMYFVPLLSPDPASSVSSPGSTLTARVISTQRRFTSTALSVKCDFEFIGLGSHQNVFDLTNEIRLLQQGGALKGQLGSITVEGAGSGQVDVEGTISNGVQTVTQVRLRFNARGKTSPVTIGLCDIHYQEGAYQYLNEVVARVNTLTFRRKAGPPKMEITVASVKKKGAGNNLWQSLKGGVKGLAVNLFIDPLTVEAAGHQAVLDFGQALVSGTPTFTFPPAKKLKGGGVD